MFIERIRGKTSREQGQVQEQKQGQGGVTRRQFLKGLCAVFAGLTLGLPTDGENNSSNLSISKRYPASQFLNPKEEGFGPEDINSPQVQEEINNLNFPEQQEQLSNPFVLKQVEINLGESSPLSQRKDGIIESLSDEEIAEVITNQGYLLLLAEQVSLASDVLQKYSLDKPTFFHNFYYYKKENTLYVSSVTTFEEANGKKGIVYKDITDLAMPFYIENEDEFGVAVLDDGRIIPYYKNNFDPNSYTLTVGESLEPTEASLMLIPEGVEYQLLEPLSFPQEVTPKEGNVNIRSNPSTQSTILTTFNKDQSLPVFGEVRTQEGNWYLIPLSSSDGSKVIAFVSGEVTIPKEQVSNGSSTIKSIPKDQLVSYSKPPEVTDPEILAHAPSSILAVENGQVVEIPVAMIAEKDGEIVALDRNGNAIAFLYPGLEINEEGEDNPYSWVVIATESNNLFPIQICLSTELKSLKLVNKTNEVLKTRTWTGDYLTSLPYLANAVDVNFHKTRDRHLLNIKVSYLSDPRFRGNIDLHPVYEGEIPQSGEEMIEAAIIHLIHLSSGLEYSKIREEIKRGKVFKITLPNGSVWDTSKGARFIQRRTYNMEDIIEMRSRNELNATIPQEIYVAESGQLVIVGLTFGADSLLYSDYIQAAFSDMAGKLGQVVDYSLWSAGINYEIFSIIFPPDGQGGYGWPLDVYASKSEITKGSPVENFAHLS